MSVIPGAIRWDAWYANTRDAKQAQNSLGPKRWQFRAPWFSTVINDYQISSVGTQANLDTEIACAANAGLKYWAFDYYNPAGGDSEFSRGWGLYQSSSLKNHINWCWLYVNTADLGSTGNYSATIAMLVSHFQQTNYQKVLSNRPLVYLFSTTAGPNWGNDSSNLAAFITDLKTAVTGAGLGSPYWVIMGGHPDNLNFMTAIGADAISAYITNVPTNGQPNTASDLNTIVANAWNSLATLGKTVPPCALGWDTRPRKQNPPTFVLGSYIPAYSRMLNYVTPLTPSDIATQLGNCVTFIGAHSSACETGALIIYAWNEFDEGGGGLCPTIGDPPQAGNITNTLAAVKSVFNP